MPIDQCEKLTLPKRNLESQWGIFLYTDSVKSCLI